MTSMNEEKKGKPRMIDEEEEEGKERPEVSLTLSCMQRNAIATSAGWLVGWRVGDIPSLVGRMIFLFVLLLYIPNSRAIAETCVIMQN